MNDKDVYKAWMRKAQNRTVTVTGPALPQFDTGAPVFILSALKGSEALSTVSRYDITLTTSLDVPEAQAASIDIASLIGTELTVTIELDGMGSLAGAMNIGAGTREISGIVTEARFVDRLNRQCRYGKTRRYLKHGIDNPIRFPGQYHDAESGLHYNRFRYYDPQAGRYINQDPIGLMGGVNSYAYSNNRPTYETDLLGLASIAAGAELGAEAGTFVLPGIGTIVGGVIGAIAGVGVTVWMANAIPSSGSQAQSQARQAEYDAYKKRCNEPPPSQSDPCEVAKWKLKRNQDCRDMRQSWDDKWQPGRHAGDIANLERGIKKLESWIDANCKKCPSNSNGKT